MLAARGSERERQLPLGIVEQLFGHTIAGGGASAGAGEADTSFATFAALMREADAWRPIAGC